MSHNAGSNHRYLYTNEPVLRVILTLLTILKEKINQPSPLTPWSMNNLVQFLSQKHS